ncbi:MAG TPA: DUF362 domain-containing protein [Candidatus Hydrogenedentes bacterium]|nr:DUF362 domain-containing protein [Candidatus Hydrogenedentota bacterium]
MHSFSRRQFLKGGATAAFAAGTAQTLSGCPPLPTPPVTPVNTMARVAAVRGTELREMTREILDKFGGAAAIVNPWETVFIKPNFGAVGMVKYNAVADGDCAKPEIVATVAEECLKAGAAEVIIGDAGQAKTYSWTKVMTLDGESNMAAEAERLRSAYPNQIVTLACLNADSPAWDPIPSPYTKLGRVYISSLINRADKVISIPVVKSHRWTQVTASMKNFVGVTSTDRYGLGIQWRFLLHDAGIEQCFLDIVRALEPDFTIIDCSICCEGNGPHVMPGWWGTTVDMRDRLGDWLLLASTDLAAADATAARVTSHDVMQVDHLVMAYNQGLGQIQENMIQLDGARMEDLRVPWQPAEHTEGFTAVLIPGIMLLVG